MPALARARQGPDTLDCGEGNDVALVRQSERGSTTLVGCETVKYPKVVPAGAARGESADEDAAAEERGVDSRPCRCRLAGHDVCRASLRCATMSA